MILPWMILFLPLVSCFLITLFWVGRPRISSMVSIAGLAASLLLSCVLFVRILADPASVPHEISIPWINLWSLKIEFGLILDRLSVLMLLVVTGVGSAIFVYSLGYMRDDPGQSRYFACLSLFAFSMLGIVLSNNFIQMFIFWELVGASSYLLIGFWYEKDAAADAGNKAFLVNRVGDFGFVLGVLVVWVLCGAVSPERTFNFLKIEAILPRLIDTGFVQSGELVLAGLLIFCGVLGKSAQFPLHVWLPDAMEGPTPVSALIHAATMVAAGIYLLARVFFLFAFSPEAMLVIAHVGAFTGIFAASLAIVQNDIKRILAYSTLSQLGLMVMTVGLGDKAAGMFHLSTHAFFKALLFLGAGSMIHALHTQNIWEMGSLFKKMPVTAATFLIGALALCGVFPLSGFWSKDEILLTALETNYVLYLLASLTSWMTSFYMARAFLVAVAGPSRRSKEPHESSAVMTWPMIVLAAGSIAAGFFGIPGFLEGRGWSLHVDLNVAIVSHAATLLGIGLAYGLYMTRGAAPAEFFRNRFKALHTVLVNKYYMDEFYDWIIRRIQQRIAVLCHWVDRNVVIGFAVNGTARLTRGAGNILRFCQTGRVQTYALIFFAGITAILFVYILK